MKEKHYLSELSREELKPMILYPAELWQKVWNCVEELNGDYAQDLAQWILGKDYTKWTKVDSCSYDWWMNIKSGQYANILDVTEYDYFSNDDAKEFKELQAKVKILKDKVDNLEDCDDYYDKIGEWEDEADELADQALQIVVKVLKQAEEVTDDQVLDEFCDNDFWGNEYYYLGDDKTKIYRDVTEVYKTNYKEER